MTALSKVVQDPPTWDVLRSESDLAGLSRRTVSEYDLLAHSIAVVCPSASALGLAVWLPSMVGPGAWLSALIGFGLAYVIALTISQFASRMAGAGSLYTYAARGLGPLAACLVAGCLLIGYAALVSFGLTNTGNKVADSVASLTGSNQQSMWVENGVLVAAVIVCVAIMVRGVHWSTRVGAVSEAIALGLLISLLAFTVVRNGLPSAAVFSLEGTDLGRIMVGAALVMTVTVGFESVAALGVEAERPLLALSRTMTRTVFLSGAVFGLALVLTTEAATPGAVSPGQRWVGTEVDVHLADGLIHAVLALSFLACALCAWTALSRIVFSLSREQVLPKVLGRTHTRWQTPHIAIVAITPVVLLPSVVSLLSGHHIGWTTHRLLGGATIVLLVTYGVVAVAVPRFLRDIDEVTAGAVTLAWIAAAGVTVLVIVDITHDLGEGKYLDLILSASVAVGALAAFRFHRRRASGDMLQLGAHDETVLGDVLRQRSHGTHG